MDSTAIGLWVHYVLDDSDCRAACITRVLDPVRRSVTLRYHEVFGRMAVPVMHVEYDPSGPIGTWHAREVCARGIRSRDQSAEQPHGRTG